MFLLLTTTTGSQITINFALVEAYYLADTEAGTEPMTLVFGRGDVPWCVKEHPADIDAALIMMDGAEWKSVVRA